MARTMPLNQVATVTVPEPRMLSVSVWDKSMVGAVDRAIRESNLGLNPIVDGTNLRIPLPELNEQRRKELVKIAHNYAEKARVAARHVRRDGMDHLKKAEKDGASARTTIGPVRAGSEDDRRDDFHDRQLACRQGSRDHAGLGRSEHVRQPESPSDDHALRMSRSSWTAMAAGRRRAGCRGSPAIALASRRCAGRSGRPASGHRLAHRLCLLLRELVAAASPRSTT